MSPSSCPQHFQTPLASGQWELGRSTARSQASPGPHCGVRWPVQLPPSSSCLLTSGKRKDALSCFLYFQQFRGLQSWFKENTTVYIYIEANFCWEMNDHFPLFQWTKGLKELQRTLKGLMLISEIVKLMRVIAIFLLYLTFSKTIKMKTVLATLWLIYKL